MHVQSFIRLQFSPDFLLPPESSLFPDLPAELYEFDANTVLVLADWVYIHLKYYAITVNTAVHAISLQCNEIEGLSKHVLPRLSAVICR